MTRRNEQLNVRLSQEEADRFYRVAEYHEISPQGACRMLMRKEALALGLEERHTRKAKKSARVPKPTSSEPSAAGKQGK